MSILTFLLLSTTAEAYSFLRVGEDGLALRFTSENPWKEGPYLPVAGNVLNQSGIYPEELEGAVVRGLQRWQSASGGAFRWDYWQGEDREVYRPQLAYDGLNSVFFLAADPSDLYLSPGTVAYTQVWYNEETGLIDEFDMVLNDLSFIFVTDPSATDYLSGPNARIVLLEDVITHELGHALGLGHSGLMSSTMFTWTWADQGHLSCDDMAGIRALYGRDSPQAGSLVGRAYDPDGLPLFGAQVVAISVDRRAPVTATLSDLDGSWTIEGLEPGRYHVLVEPFYSQGQNLSEHYAGLDHRLCGEELFSRTFLEEQGRPETVGVYPGGQSRVPDIEVRCRAEGGAAVEDSGAGPELEQAPHLFAEGADEFSLLALGAPGPDDQLFALPELEGDLYIDLVAWSLYSPLFARMDLLDAEGQEVELADDDYPRVSIDESGYQAWDVTLVAHDLPAGDYYLRLQANRLEDSDYPRADLYLDAQPFMLLFGSKGLDAWTEEGLEPEPPDCRQQEDFAEYSSPGGPPLRREVPAPGSAGCGLPGWASPPGLALCVLLAPLRRRRRSAAP